MGIEQDRSYRDTNKFLARHYAKLGDPVWRGFALAAALLTTTITQLY